MGFLFGELPPVPADLATTRSQRTLIRFLNELRSKLLKLKFPPFYPLGLDSPGGGDALIYVPSWVFGGGTDGAVHFDGTATFAAFATKSGNTYTLIRNLWGTDVTIDAGVTVITDSMQMFCTGTFACNGHLSMDGGDGSNSVAGQPIAINNGYYVPGKVGGTGATNVSTPGQAGTASSLQSLGGAAGAGGAGATSAGGAAGALNPPANQVGGVGVGYLLTVMLSGHVMLGNVITPLCGAPGGGGGGEKNPAAGANGGGGGAGAGIIGLFAKLIAGSGTITAKGGNGFPGNAPTAGGGGGGGGGGGAILAASTTLWASISSMFSVAGGLGGTVAGGAFVAGSDGAPGTLAFVQL